MLYVPHAIGEELTFWQVRPFKPIMPFPIKRFSIAPIRPSCYGACAA